MWTFASHPVHIEEGSGTENESLTRFQLHDLPKELVGRHDCLGVWISVVHRGAGDVSLDSFEPGGGSEAMDDGYIA